MAETWSTAMAASSFKWPTKGDMPKRLNYKPYDSINPNLEIYTIDVQHGDATLIKTKDQITLIDCGHNKSNGRTEETCKKNLIDILTELQVTVIDNLIITHPHQDHDGNVLQLLMPKPADVPRPIKNLLSHYTGSWSGEGVGYLVSSHTQYNYFSNITVKNLYVNAYPGDRRQCYVNYAEWSTLVNEGVCDNAKTILHIVDTEHNNVINLDNSGKVKFTVLWPTPEFIDEALEIKQTSPDEMSKVLPNQSTSSDSVNTEEAEILNKRNAIKVPEELDAEYQELFFPTTDYSIGKTATAQTERKNAQTNIENAKAYVKTSNNTTDGTKVKVLYLQKAIVEYMYAIDHLFTAAEADANKCNYCIQHYQNIITCAQEIITHCNSAMALTDSVTYPNDFIASLRFDIINAYFHIIDIMLNNKDEVVNRNIDDMWTDYCNNSIAYKLQDQRSSSAKGSYQTTFDKYVEDNKLKKDTMTSANIIQAKRKATASYNTAYNNFELSTTELQAAQTLKANFNSEEITSLQDGYRNYCNSQYYYDISIIYNNILEKQLYNNRTLFSRKNINDIFTKCLDKETPQSFSYTHYNQYSESDLEEGIEAVPFTDYSGSTTATKTMTIRSALKIYNDLKSDYEEKSNTLSSNYDKYLKGAANITTVKTSYDDKQQSERLFCAGLSGYISGQKIRYGFTVANAKTYLQDPIYLTVEVIFNEICNYDIIVYKDTRHYQEEKTCLATLKVSDFKNMGQYMTNLKEFTINSYSNYIKTNVTSIPDNEIFLRMIQAEAEEYCTNTGITKISTFFNRLPEMIINTAMELKLGTNDFNSIESSIDYWWYDRTTNNTSIVGKITYNSFSMLMTGDCGCGAWQKIVRSRSVSELKSNVMKSPHHGTERNTYYPAVAAIRPEAVVYSMKPYRYTSTTIDHITDGIPSVRSVQIPVRLGTQIGNMYCTRHNGNIAMRTDGYYYDFKPKKEVNKEHPKELKPGRAAGSSINSDYYFTSIPTDTPSDKDKGWVNIVMAEKKVETKDVDKNMMWFITY